MPPPTPLGNARAARELRMTRATTHVKPNAETDCELNGVHTPAVAKGQPQVNPVTGPLDFAQGDRGLIPFSFSLYTCKTTARSVFFPDGVPSILGPRHCLHDQQWARSGSNELCGGRGCLFVQLVMSWVLSRGTRTWARAALFLV